MKSSIMIIKAMMMTSMLLKVIYQFFIIIFLVNHGSAKYVKGQLIGIGTHGSIF